jgi:transcriptional regulator with XRE-family HTH domain
VVHGFRILLGSRLVQLREEQALEVADVAVMAPCTRAHLYAVERGTSWPSVELLLALAKIYKVDEADFFVWPGKGPRHDAREQVRLGSPHTVAALLSGLPAVTPMPIKERDRRRGPRKRPSQRAAPPSASAVPPASPPAGTRRRPRR